MADPERRAVDRHLAAFGQTVESDSGNGIVRVVVDDEERAAEVRRGPGKGIIPTERDIPVHAMLDLRLQQR